MPDGTGTDLAVSPIVRVAGVEVPALSTSLVQLDVRAELGVPARLDLVLADWGPASDGSVGFLWSDRAVVDFGREIEVVLGGADSAPVFAGRITGLRGEFRPSSTPRLVVTAHDALWSLGEVRRTRTFEEVTDVDAAGVVADDHGLAFEADVADEVEHARIVQLAATDLEFLRERAARLGAGLAVRDGTLHLWDASRGLDDEFELEFGRSLRSFSPQIELSGQRTRVSVVGWNVEEGAEIREDADSAPAPTGSALESGGEVLEASFGERRSTLELRAESDEEARLLAEVDLAARARRFVRGDGECDGDPRLRPGEVVRLVGVGDLFEGAYRLLSVQHTLTAAHGWSTSFTCERAGAARAACDPGKGDPGKGGSGKGDSIVDRPTKWDRITKWASPKDSSQEDDR